MTKKFLFATISLVLLLSGCFGLFRKKEPAVRTVAPAQEAVETKIPAASSIKVPSRPDIPSFNDGDIYLKALASREAELCKKIGSANLKSRCEKEVKKP